MPKRAGTTLLATAIALALPQTASAQPTLATVAAPAAEDARLTAFLDTEFEQDLKLRPQLATRLGSKIGYDRWDDISDAGLLRRLTLKRASVARMRTQFDRAKLSQTGQSNYDIWAGELDRLELQYRFRRYQPPFYSFLYSIHSDLPDFLINTHTVGSLADARAYIERLRALPTVLDTGLIQMRNAARLGVHAPRFQVERVIAGSDTLTAGVPFGEGADAPLWADLKAKVGKLEAASKVSPAEAATLLAQGRAAVLGLRPAYARVIAWARRELPTAPAGKVGAGSLPGGADWYAAALKLNTTLDVSAEEVHRIGLAEVQRIEAEQDALARQAGLADRNAFYADRARRFPPLPYTEVLRAEYLGTANEAIARNRSLLPGRFNLLPKYRVEVVREPAFSEVAGGAAHAAGPSPDGTRPGRVYLHMLGETLDPAKVQDLMCHEGIPGHVMQGDIQVRRTGTPKFRMAGGYVAYGEGWALYSELLCKEMGAYTDVAADFMRLDAELFRAARLVTDTGIHAEGWSEDQAVEYMTGAGRLPAQQARSEVRRYITLPGQATGYKIGMLKIMELRERAATALGEKFDIKTFDDLIVGEGSQPLPVLQRRIESWIAAQR